jgi:poly(ADP-ribose) glycohydrolase ARH3
MDRRTTRDRAAGCFLGLAVGDALGAAREGSPPGPFQWDGEVPIHYTDDTEMTVGLIEALIEDPALDQDGLARRFVANYTSWRGYGPGTRLALSLVRKGRPWREAARGRFGDGSLGNGAAMRAAPVGPLCPQDPARLRDLAERQAEVTHLHPLGKEGAVVVAYAAAAAYRDSVPPGEALLEELAAFTKLDEYRRKFRAAIELLRRPHDPRRVIQELGNRVEAVESAPTAIYLFARYPADYNAAVASAIELGGDTDTIAAMAGALVGARVGKSSLPAMALERLEDVHWLDALAERYATLVASRAA